MSSDSAPLITILVPTYNRLGSLKKLVAWLEKHAFHNPDVSILISNNASKDETRAYLDGYSHIPNLNINHMPSNCGALIHIGWLYAQATTPYVWLIGDDDCPEEDALYQVISILKADREIVWLHLPHRFVDNQGNIACESLKPNEVLIKENGADLFIKYANWATLISSNILKTEEMQKYISRCDAGNAFFPLWLNMQTGSGHKSVVINMCLVNANTDYSWSETRRKVCTKDLINVIKSLSGISGSDSAHILYNYYIRDPSNFIRVPFIAPMECLWLLRISPFKFAKRYIISFLQICCIKLARFYQSAS